MNITNELRIALINALSEGSWIDGEMTERGQFQIRLIDMKMSELQGYIEEAGEQALQHGKVIRATLNIVSEDKRHISICDSGSGYACYGFDVVYSGHVPVALRQNNTHPNVKATMEALEKFMEVCGV